MLGQVHRQTLKHTLPTIIVIIATMWVTITIIAIVIIVKSSQVDFYNNCNSNSIVVAELIEPLIIVVMGDKQTSRAHISSYLHREV